MFAALAMITALLVLSVVSAFMGAEKSARFFNSPPMAAFWVLLWALLIAAFFVFSRLLRRPGLLALHLGCILVLTGGMLGSKPGHKALDALFNKSKIVRGYMIIEEGSAESAVYSPDLTRSLGNLDFEVFLEDFRIEYYGPAAEHGLLTARTPDGCALQIPAKPGNSAKFAPDGATIEITRVFENFKIDVEAGRRIARDAPGPGRNPALEVTITAPDGTQQTRYVFERFAGHHGDEQIHLSYVSQPPRPIRDYISEVKIRRDGRTLKSAEIEVNHPLHYGGYYFYQHSYDSENENFTVLTVVSDRGLPVVFAGYILLCGGTAGHFWLRRSLYKKKASVNA